MFEDVDDFRLLGSEIHGASGNGLGGSLTSVLYLTDLLAEPLVELGLFRFTFGSAAFLTSASFSRIVGENPSGSFHLTCMVEQWQHQGPSTPQERHPNPLPLPTRRQMEARCVHTRIRAWFGPWTLGCPKTCDFRWTGRFWAPQPPIHLHCVYIF
jgi:hypothetical protein